MLNQCFTHDQVFLETTKTFDVGVAVATSFIHYIVAINIALTSFRRVLSQKVNLFIDSLQVSEVQQAVLELHYAKAVNQDY